VLSLPFCLCFGFLSGLFLFRGLFVEISTKLIKQEVFFSSQLWNIWNFETCFPRTFPVDLPCSWLFISGSSDSLGFLSWSRASGSCYSTITKRFLISPWGFFLLFFCGFCDSFFITGFSFERFHHDRLLSIQVMCSWVLIWYANSYGIPLLCYDHLSFLYFVISFWFLSFFLSFEETGPSTKLPFFPSFSTKLTTKFSAFS